VGGRRVRHHGRGGGRVRLSRGRGGGWATRSVLWQRWWVGVTWPTRICMQEGGNWCVMWPWLHVRWWYWWWLGWAVTRPSRVCMQEGGSGSGVG
jgi:hypothetical protein